MYFKFILLLCPLFLFSYCTPYWENESLNELDHNKITKEANKASSLPQNNVQSENDLMGAAFQLEKKTGELSNEIDNLLIDFNDL